jgi:YihY family inner membrane protein
MQSTFAKLKRRIGKPLSQFPFYIRWIAAVYRYFIHVVRVWQSRDFFRISSALAFESLFSLVPLAALSLWIIDAVGQSVHVKSFTNYIGKQLFPSFGPNAMVMISKMAGRIKGEYIGTFGVVATLFISILVFLSVEKAFNEVWEVKQKRGSFSQFATYWTLASLIPLMALLIFLRRTDFPFFSSVWIAHGILLFFFFLGNLLIPNTKVKVFPALVGAMSSFLLFQIARWGVSKYFTSKYFGIYGEIGVLFLMLVWIYYTWVVIMFGSIVSYVFQRFNYLEERRIIESRWAVFPGEPLSWRAWAILDFLYYHRELHDTQAISLALGDSADLVERVCLRLEEQGFVFKVEGRWGLAQEDGKRITIAHIAKTFARPVPGETGKATLIWQELSDYFMAIAENISLKESFEKTPEEIIRETELALERQEIMANPQLFKTRNIKFEQKKIELDSQKQIKNKTIEQFKGGKIEKPKVEKVVNKEKLKVEKVVNKEKLKVEKVEKKEKPKVEKVVNKEKLKVEKVEKKEKPKVEKVVKKEVEKLEKNKNSVIETSSENGKDKNEQPETI